MADMLSTSITYELMLKNRRPMPPRRKAADGRHWELGSSNTWKLQCRRCARYCSTSVFAVTGERNGKPEYALKCNSCAERDGETPVVKTAQPDRECGQCDRTLPYVYFARTDTPGKAYGYCYDCREQAKRIRDDEGSTPCILDRAYKQVFPDLVEYGERVTGYEILSNPKKYPGRTYFHLSKTERNRAISLAKEMLFTEQGIDLRMR